MAKKADKFLRHRYFAIVDGKGDVWGAVVPDFPGCHGGGATIAEAVDDATSALSEFAGLMEIDGQALPEPTDLSEIERTREAEGEPRGIAVQIPLLIESGRTVRANISLDARLLKTIDNEADLRGVTRSTFLVSAALEKIAEQR